MLCNLSICLNENFIWLPLCFNEMMLVLLLIWFARTNFLGSSCLYELPPPARS